MQNLTHMLLFVFREHNQKEFFLIFICITETYSERELASTQRED